jgi:hypothetical protein
MRSDAEQNARWKRLFSMSSREIGDRARQEICKRTDWWRYRLGGLKPGSPLPQKRVDAAASFFFAPQQVPQIVALLRERLPKEVDGILASAEKICAHRFDLLGYQNLDYGSNIDWHLDRVHGKRAPRKPWYQIRFLDFNEVGDVKVTWELNRHQHLVTLAKAYAISRDDGFVKELLTQWYDWAEQNPYPIGVNWASSLEVAFRAISWLWVRNLVAGCSAVPQQFAIELAKALAISGRHIERYLSTFFSPNTHLLGEGVGLYFLGVLCPELNRAEKWKRLGWRIVMEQADAQVLPDGMHFEQSLYYHVYALDFFLHAALLGSRNGALLPEHFERTLEKILDALLRITQAGITPRFGDDDGGRVFDGRRNRAEHLLDPLPTGAVLFGRGDFKRAAAGLREETVWLLGAEGAARFDELDETATELHSVALPDSGTYVMACAKHGPVQLVIDAGRQGVYGGGHGHADALSLQLAQSGQALLVDPGTGAYVGSDSTRMSFRITAAHNTLQVDGLSQSAPKGAFSWKRLTNTTVHEWIQGEHFDLFAGSHDGYAPVVHRRWVFYCKPDFWLVRDVVEGAGKHRIAVHWHLAPSMLPQNITQQKKTFLVFGFPEKASAIALAPSEDSRCETKLHEGEYSSVYGRKERTQILRTDGEFLLPAELGTILTTSVAIAGKLTRVADHSDCKGVHGYCYSRFGERHTMYFADGEQHWSLCDWTSDAKFLYVRESDAEVKGIIFCRGSFVEFRGGRVVSAERQVESCELNGRNGKVISGQKELLRVHQWPEPAFRQVALERGVVRVEK